MSRTNAKIVAVIPARAGSKRLPGKNMKLFCRKPLLYWTIDQALACDFIDEVIITTDDKDIQERCEYFWRLYPSRIKVVNRPKELAQDDTPMWKVIEHIGTLYDEDIIVIVLQPTSPLRTSEDIRNACAMFDYGLKRFGVVSAYWESHMYDVRLNGAIYINWLSSIVILKTLIFKFTIFYLMPKERSIDIDTLEDFMNAEFEMKKRLSENE